MIERDQSLANRRRLVDNANEEPFGESQSIYVVTSRE